MDDVAVIGVGLRFPGDATNPTKLWDVLENGTSQWSEFPKDRLNIDGYYHPGGDRQGSISFRGAHFIKEDISAFDASFFSVAAEDAKAIDPQQRLLLEISYEALENAGIRKEDIAGSDTAVYVGSFVKDYEQICLRDPDWQPQYAATGNGIAIMANRISYFFNLHGPSMTIDTGCSGSLVAVHLAAQSLRTGESSLAIAAGAGMILTPNTIMPMTALNFLSPDGKCFTFDSRANGYGRGEGVGVVILKRLSDALRDNDPIRGVIRASHVNQDGRTTGITLPSKEAQVANIRAVYKEANLEFDQTGYVECHGTGTQAGDWRELKAISETLASVRSQSNPIFVGSIKPNIGHLEGAAGVAGLIKGVLMLEHGKVPPHINFLQGNPDVSFDEWKVQVTTALMDWPVRGTRRVSVNCFGFGGTNAHVVMDEAPSPRVLSRLQRNRITKFIQPPEFLHREHATLPNWQPFCYSSHEKSGIQRIIASHSTFLEENNNTEGEADFLDNYAFTLACRRSNLEWKQFAVAKSVQDLGSKLQALGGDTIRRSAASSSPRLCFVFCGQGSQWARMGQGLQSNSTFWYSLNTANWYLKTVLGSPYDLVEEIMKPEEISRISVPEISQPATTAIQVALVELFRSFDVKPDYVVGHSSGEIAAAFASGAMTRETAWELAYYRGLAAGSIPHLAPHLKGAMIAVALSREEAVDYLRGIEKHVQLACVNSPKSVTLSGAALAVEELARTFEEKRVYCRILKVDTAYHSSHMKLVEEDYRQALSGLTLTQSSEFIFMFSSVSGTLIDAQQLTGEYWVQNMVSTVQYAQAVQSLMDLSKSERPTIFVELSPSPVLRSPTLENLPSDAEITYVPTLSSKLNDSEAILQAVGKLWSHGCNINMRKVMSTKSPKMVPRCLSSLPPYPWNHSSSYWHESHLSLSNRFREFGRRDLIGAPTADAISFEPRWRGFLRVSENPWIQDHQIQKTIVYPAAGMVSMVLEGATQLACKLSDVEGFEICNMVIDQAMIVPQTFHGLEVALNMKVVDSLTNMFDFSIYSKKLDKEWEKHASGSLRIQVNASDLKDHLADANSRHDWAKTHCVQRISPREMYETLDVMGINYGPLFQNITSLHRSDTHCVAKVSVPDTQSKMPARFEYPHLIHPGTLDSMFQTLFAIRLESRLPKYISRLFVSSALGSGHGIEFEGYATARPRGLRDVQANITMHQVGNPAVGVVVQGFQLAGMMDFGATSNCMFLPNYRNLCSQVIWEEDVCISNAESINRLLRQMCHKHGVISVLQIGGSTSTFAGIVASTVAPNQHVPRLSRYSVMGTVSADILALVPSTPLVDIVHSVDLEEVQLQYDIIVQCEDVGINVNDKLKGGGFMFKGVPSLNGSSHTTSSPILTLATESAAETCEALGLKIEAEPQLHFLLVHNEIREKKDLRVHILVPDRGNDKFLQEFAHRLLCQFSADSEIVFSKDAARTCVEGQNVVSLLELDPRCGIFNWQEDDFAKFRMVSDCSRAVLHVTQGAYMIPTAPQSSPIVGLTRTIRSEDLRKNVGLLDIDTRNALMDERSMNAILSVCNRIFDHTSNSQGQEFEYALLDGKLHTPRLVVIEPLNRIIDPEFPPSSIKNIPWGQYLNDTAAGLEFDVDADDRRRFKECSRQEPEPTEVEIVITQAFLAQEDADILCGKTDNTTVGLDLIGYVRRLGSKVTDFQIGDQVVAMAPHNGTLQNVICVHVDFVHPHNIESVPSAGAAAFYSLAQKQTIHEGSRILVYGGTTPFGCACIDIAIAKAADVYATVSGADSEQRKFLTSRGLDSSRILNHDDKVIFDSPKFATIVNATSSHFEGLHNLIEAGGTMVQLVTHATEAQGIHVPQSSVTIVNVDIRQLLREQPLLVSNALKLYMDTIKVKTPVQVQRFDISSISDAFSSLSASSSHAVIDFCSDSVVPVAMSTPVSEFRTFIDPDRTYVLSGGLGGLGRSISRLLLDSGARHLAYLSRSGGSSPESREFMDGLISKRINAKAYAVDICNTSGVEHTIRSIVQDMPPVCGVFHCAAVIKDAVFDNMTYEDWKAAVDPKTQGPWNLVEALRTIETNTFHIFLASSSGVIGSRGQANYAAGNAFLDSLAHYCRLFGLPSVSIDLGPILGAGMVADDEETLNMLRASGFYGIRHPDFITVVKHCIMLESTKGVPMPAQVVLGVGTGGLVAQNKPADPYWTRTALFSHLALVDMPKVGLVVQGNTEDVGALLGHCSDFLVAVDIVCQGLCKMLAKSMNMMPEEIDSSRPPNTYGVDSLVAVGVRNWVHGNCNVEVSVFEIMSDSTIHELAALVVERRW